MFTNGFEDASIQGQVVISELRHRFWGAIFPGI